MNLWLRRMCFCDCFASTYGDGFLSVDVFFGTIWRPYLLVCGDGNGFAIAITQVMCVPKDATQTLWVSAWGTAWLSVMITTDTHLVILYRYIVHTTKKVKYGCSTSCICRTYLGFHTWFGQLQEIMLKKCPVSGIAPGSFYWHLNMLGSLWSCRWSSNV